MLTPGGLNRHPGVFDVPGHIEHRGLVPKAHHAALNPDACNDGFVIHALLIKIISDGPQDVARTHPNTRFAASTTPSASTAITITHAAILIMPPS